MMSVGSVSSLMNTLYSSPLNNTSGLFHCSYFQSCYYLAERRVVLAKRLWMEPAEKSGSVYFFLWDRIEARSTSFNFET